MVRFLTAGESHGRALVVILEGVPAGLRCAVVVDAEADATWAAALKAETVAAAIEAFAHSIRLRWEHGADIVATNADAARSDPAIRAEVDAAVHVHRRHGKVDMLCLDLSKCGEPIAFF